MRLIEEFRSGELGRTLARKIAATVEPGRQYHLMEFCGGHTHAIYRYGIEDLMPEGVHFIHGPGCPVCVLPTRNSLLKAKAAGADVRMVYSTLDALQIARDHPDREVLFFAIGFETTTPPTAVAIQQAATEGLENFSVFCNHVLTPAAIQNILEAPEVREFGTVPIDGFLGPSHVSAVIGSRPYEYFAAQYQRPVVIAGFEPLDVMQSVLMLIRQLNAGRFEVENEYHRVVTREGNLKAQALVADVFQLRPLFEWRGLGEVPYSALRINDNYVKYDAEARFDFPEVVSKDIRGCACPAILRGAKRPSECKLFGTICTPENPMGSCMVSSEGACAAYWSYGRFRHQRE